LSLLLETFTDGFADTVIDKVAAAVEDGAEVAVSAFRVVLAGSPTRGVIALLPVEKAAG
jgi:hypothetical protein